MNRSIRSAVLASMAIVAGSCGEPTAPEQLGVGAAVVAANEGATSVDACGTVISEPGRYRLTADLIDCSDALAGAAIVIRANDVILRLDGHRIASSAVGAVQTCLQATGDRIRIVGPGSLGFCWYGILFEGVTKSSVSNLQVQGDLGIVLDNVSDITLDRLSMVDNVDYALYEYGPVSDLVLRHSFVRGTGFGANGVSLSGTRITIEHNEFEQLTSTVALAGDDNRVVGNRITNTGIGISIVGTASQVLRNVLSGVSAVGIRVSGSGNLISGNRLFDNTGTDLMDLNGVCGVNIWQKNRADTRSPACLE